MKAFAKVLMIGYGNPGRLDDGLGPLFIEKLRDAAGDQVTLDSDYQLTVEDAAQIKEHDTVIFVDADLSGPEPFHFTELKSSFEMSFTTHSVRPEALLGMTEKYFGKKVTGYILGIRGYEFDDFGERLSKGALKNLETAFDFILNLLEEQNFEVAASKYGKPS